MFFGSPLIYPFSVLPCFVQQINTICQIQTLILRRTFCITLTFFMELQWENHCYMCHTISTLKAIEDSSRGLADKWILDSSEDLIWGISLQISPGNVYCCAHQPSLVWESVLHLQLWESEPANYWILPLMTSLQMHFKENWGFGSSYILHTPIYDHYIPGIYLNTH